MPQVIQFFRHFRGPTGGHLKVFHQYQFALESGDWQPYIQFTPNSVMDEHNPWMAYRDTVGFNQTHDAPDVVFIAGMDWERLPPYSADIPRINYVQSTRHALPSVPRYAFLSEKAIRIVVNPEIAEAILATGLVNGPALTNPHGYDAADFPPVCAYAEKTTDVFIYGMKNPTFALALAEQLRAFTPSLDIETDFIPRAEILARINAARFFVGLPLQYEGNFMPVFEALALNTIPITTQSAGNGLYALSGFNGLRAPYNLDGLTDAVRRMLLTPAPILRLFRENARRTVTAYTHDDERAAFLDILNHAHAILSGID